VDEQGFGSDDRQDDEDAKGDGQEYPGRFAALAGEDLHHARPIRMGFHEGADGFSTGWATIKLHWYVLRESLNLQVSFDGTR
jgi:hypothetical protein